MNLLLMAQPALNKKAARLSLRLSVFPCVRALVEADRGQFVLHRRAIGAGITVGETQHTAVLGMQDIQLHASGQIDIGRDQAKAVRLVTARGLDVGDAAGGELPSSMSSLSNLSVMVGLQS